MQKKPSHYFTVYCSVLDKPMCLFMSYVPIKVNIGCIARLHFF